MRYKESVIGSAEMVSSRCKTYWTLFVCAITHTFVHVFTFMHTALIPVFMDEFALSIFESGLLVSIPLVLTVSISIPYGVLTDRIGHRKLMIASLLVSGIAGLAISQAKDFYTLLFPLLFVPLASTLYHPPALSIVSELPPENWRNRVLGIHGAGGTTGVAIGPITLGLIMERFGWRSAYLAWSFPILLSSLFLLRLPESPESAEHLGKADEKLSLKMDLESQKENRYSRTLRYGYMILLLAMSVKGMGDRSLSTYMTTYLVSNRGLTRSMASLIYGFNPVMGILGSLSGGYLADRVGSKRWMILAYLGRAFVLAGMYLSPLGALVIIYFVGGYFGGSTMGPSSSLVAGLSPRRRRGLAYAIFMLPFSLVGAISPMIAAQIIEAYNVAALFPFAISLTLASILLLKQFPRTHVGNNG